MSLLMQMLQQSQIQKGQERSESLQSRVDHLEFQVEHQGKLLHELVVRLEKRLGEDLEETLDL